MRENRRYELPDFVVRVTSRLMAGEVVAIAAIDAAVARQGIHQFGQFGCDSPDLASTTGHQREHPCARE